MAAKTPAVQIVTANRLTDGLVVYFTSDGVWSDQRSDAATAEGKEAGEALLGRALEDERTEVAGPYLIGIDAVEGARTPERLRERIRINGPTVRPDLCRQPEEWGAANV